VTATIGASGELARKAAAQVIAKIAFIEITPERNGWPGLLPGLVGTAMRADLPPEPRATALTALGFTLEELDAYDASPLEQPDVDSALTVICSSMQLAAPRAMQVAAGAAMLNTLPFVSANFEEEARAPERDAIMMAVCTATTSEDIDTKRLAFACLEKAAELYYAYLGSYMKVLADLTAQAARHADEAVATSALGFWTEIAETEGNAGEGEPNHGFTAQALGPLVDMVTDIMATAAADVDDDELLEAYGVAEAAQMTLQAIAGAVKDAVVDPVMRFINANFMSPDAKRRDAAIMAFGLIMEGPKPETLRARYIRDVLPHLFGRLKGGAAPDASTAVRSSAGFALANIFEGHVEVLNLGTELLPTVASLCAALEDEPAVVHQVTRALDNLVESASELDAFSPDGGHATLMTPVFYATINALMTRADKPDAEDSVIRADCYAAIATIVGNGAPADAPVLVALLGECVARVEASVGRMIVAPTAAARQAEASLHDAIVGLAAEIVLNVGAECLPQADGLVAAMVRVIDARTATADAWRALSAVFTHLDNGAAPGEKGAAAAAAAAGVGVTRYLGALWPRMMAALGAPADAVGCKSALLFAGEAVRGLGPRLAERAPELLTALIKLLSDTLVERELKPVALSALGDVAMALGRDVLPYVGTMHAVVMGAAGLEAPPRGADPEMEEYVLEVRAVCLDAWTGVFAAFAPPEAAEVEERARAQGAAAGALSALPAAGGAATNLVGDVLAVLARWVEGWRAAALAAPRTADGGVPEDVADAAMLKKTVALVGDVAAAVGTAYCSSLGVSVRTPWVKFLLEEAHRAELADAAANDEAVEPKNTMAAYAKRMLPK